MYIEAMSNINGILSKVISLLCLFIIYVSHHYFEEYLSSDTFENRYLYKDAFEQFDKRRVGKY